MKVRIMSCFMAAVLVLSLAGCRRDTQGEHSNAPQITNSPGVRDGLMDDIGDAIGDVADEAGDAIRHAGDSFGRARK